VIYADTSFLASIYMPDANTPGAKQVVASITDPFPFTALHRLELRNAISLAVFQRRFSSTDALAFWRDVEADIAASRLIELSLIGGDVFHEAETLAAAQTPAIGSRSLDILHVVAARILQTQEFLTFDTRQVALAAQLGMNLTPLPP